jgi:glutathione S-transferase
VETTTMQALKDVYQILQFLTKEKGLDGDTQAALGRLRAAVMTEGEHAVQTLEQLQARRAYLKPRRITLADRADHLAAIVPQLPAKATPTQQQKAHHARLAADRAKAELNACVVELADVEAAIGQH